MIKETGGIVQCITIEVAHTHDQLDGVAQGMPGCGQICNNEAKRPPQQLDIARSVELVRRSLGNGSPAYRML